MTRSIDDIINDMMNKDPKKVGFDAAAVVEFDEDVENGRLETLTEEDEPAVQKKRPKAVEEEIAYEPRYELDDTEKSMPLDVHDDPFARREGKTLTWRNVDMTLVSGGL